MILLGLLELVISIQLIMVLFLFFCWRKLIMVLLLTKNK